MNSQWCPKFRRLSLISVISLTVFLLSLSPDFATAHFSRQSSSVGVISAGRPTRSDPPEIIEDRQNAVSNQALITQVNPAPMLRLASRSIDQWQLADFLLIGTIDGSLHARDRKTGVEVWSIPGDGPLVRVSTADTLKAEATSSISLQGSSFTHNAGTSSSTPNSDDSKSQDNEITWIVEPIGDGLLYYFMTSTGLQQLPVSIKQLVLESPFAIHGDDKIYTGSRHTTLYSVDAKTGVILGVYGGSGFKRADQPQCNAHPKNARGLAQNDEDDMVDVEPDHSTFMIGKTGK